MTDLARWWPLPDADDLRAELEAAYADPARGYHDSLHLREVLERLDELGGRSRTRWCWRRGSTTGCTTAGRAPRNARPSGSSGRSRRRASTRHGRGGGPAGPADRAPPARRGRRTPVRCSPTRTSASSPRVPERYAAYVATVRREYAHVPDREFAAGRAAILGDLLAKPTLFHTAYAREHWEATARANVGPGAGGAGGAQPGTLSRPCAGLRDVEPGPDAERERQVRGLVTDGRVEQQRDAERAEPVHEQRPDDVRVAAVGEPAARRCRGRRRTNRPGAAGSATGRGGRAPRGHPPGPRSSRSPRG